MIGEIPPRGLLDYLSRVDELLIMNVQAIRALNENIGVLAGGRPITPGGPLRLPDVYEIPVGLIGRYSGADLDWQEVVAWSIPTDRSGVLRFVEIDSTDWAKTRLKLEGAGKVLFTEVQIDHSLSLEFADPNLAPGSKVVLSAKSSDGTTITVTGDISGKERPR